MAETRATIINPSGLHTRPAARFVEVASSFKADVLVKNLTTDSRNANAKSILGILTLGVESGHEILIHTFGENEQSVQYSGESGGRRTSKN
jgi:phosphotransferase system HPr (HPr) family protein